MVTATRYQKHEIPVNFIELSGHHRVIVILNCCQLYEITVSKFTEQL